MTNKLQNLTIKDSSQFPQKEILKNARLDTLQILNQGPVNNPFYRKSTISEKLPASKAIVQP